MQVATCWTQTINQNTNVLAEVCKVPIKRTSRLTVKHTGGERHYYEPGQDFNPDLLNAGSSALKPYDNHTFIAGHTYLEVSVRVCNEHSL